MKEPRKIAEQQEEAEVTKIVTEERSKTELNNFLVDSFSRVSDTKVNNIKVRTACERLF